MKKITFYISGILYFGSLFLPFTKSPDPTTFQLINKNGFWYIYHNWPLFLALLLVGILYFMVKNEWKIFASGAFGIILVITYSIKIFILGSLTNWLEYLKNINGVGYYASFIIALIFVIKLLLQARNSVDSKKRIQ